MGSGRTRRLGILVLDLDTNNEFGNLNLSKYSSFSIDYVTNSRKCSVISRFPFISKLPVLMMSLYSILVLGKFW